MSDSTVTKRLYKSRTERMIDGVCGGVAKYFNLDPTLVRIAWVLLTFFGGSGILLYIVAMIVMPKEPYSIPTYPSPDPTLDSATVSTDGSSASSKKNSLFWGILLIGLGMVLFLHNMGFSFWHPWWWFDRDLFFPVLLILTGVAFMWGGRNSLTKSSESIEGQTIGSAAQSSKPAEAAPRRLYRSFNDSKLFGVCGGLGEYFGIDPTILRAVFIVGAFASGGIVVVGYIIMAIVLPKAAPSFNAL